MNENRQGPVKAAIAIQSPVPTGYKTWNDYWTQVHGQSWRIRPEIGGERMEYLKSRLAVKTAIETGRYRFQEIKLDRADVEWLLGTHESNGMKGPVDWSDEKQRERTGVDLRGADLRSVDLHSLPLARTRFGLVGHDWLRATPRQREAAVAHLEGAFLAFAHLEHARIGEGRLQGADLREAHLEGADLRGAHLEGTNLYGAFLQGADLRVAFFDTATTLTGITLRAPSYDGVALADAHWQDANIAVVNWVTGRKSIILGDEDIPHRPNPRGITIDRATKLEQYHSAVRANRQVSTLLRAQGLNEESDRFAYRAQILQRQVFLRQGQLGRWLSSLMLAALSGYGYRLGRIAIAYVFIVLVFAAAFLTSSVATGQAPLTWQGAFDALQISLNAIHGRVFFIQFGLDTLQSWLATAESIIGIAIEGVFVAMLIQRFFSR